IVGPERAALAPGVPGRIEHEMLDDQLAAPVEQVAQGGLARRSLELIGLVDTLPRQRATQSAELVAQPGELLFLGEQLQALRQPFLTRNHPVLFHPSPPPPQRGLTIAEGRYLTHTLSLGQRVCRSSPNFCSARRPRGARSSRG